MPSYWASYGPTNFLYFCDVALFFTAVAIWRENALLAGAAAVGILIPQLLWVVDFTARFFDIAPTGMTAYMFDSNIALFYRGLSTFHGWLPMLLLYLVHSLGYDKRAFWLWTATAEILLLVCYFFMPAPPGPERIPGATNPPVNINYVFGMSDQAAQTMMPELAWLAFLMIGLPLLIFWPTHLILNHWRGRESIKRDSNSPQTSNIGLITNSNLSNTGMGKS